MGRVYSERESKLQSTLFPKRISDSELEFRFGRDLTNLSRPAQTLPSPKKVKKGASSRPTPITKPKTQVLKSAFVRKVKLHKQQPFKKDTKSQKSKTLLEEQIDKKNWNVPSAVAYFHKEILEYLGRQEVREH
jgi:hypothetical protein